MSRSFFCSYDFEQSSGFICPFNKPLIDELWFCRLRKGRIKAIYEHDEYEICAIGEDVSFLVADGVSFSIVSVSQDCHLEVIAISHESMSLIYPQLGNDVIDCIVVPQLIDTRMMDVSIKNLIMSAFAQGKELGDNEGNLILMERILISYATCFIYLFHNGISMWIKEHESSEESRPDSSSKKRSFKIMNDLAEVFNDPEAFCHREVNYFANRLHISLRYFFQVCQKETGMSPKAFINDVIISEIKHTLRTTSLSIQEICLKYDFPDQSAFTQYFKRCTGITPTEFRKHYD